MFVLLELCLLFFVLCCASASSDSDGARHGDLNVHLVHRSPLTGSALLRGAAPVTERERYALPALRLAFAGVLSGELPPSYRLLVVSLLRFGVAPPVPTSHSVPVCAGFLRNGVDVATNGVDSADLKRCLTAARRAGIAAAQRGSERQVQFVPAFQCVLPAGWFLDEQFVSISGNRLLFCNVDTAAHVLAHRHDPASSSFADLLYVDRHHKDFARAELEWRFVREHGAAERMQWLSMPMIGESLDPAATFRHNATLGADLAAALEDWLPDQLVSRVRRLRHLLDSERGLLIYVHCAAGIDRSGELAGAVELSLGASWRAVVERALRISGKRDLKQANMIALQWYCLYEKYGPPARSELDCWDTPQGDESRQESSEE